MPTLGPKERREAAARRAEEAQLQDMEMVEASHDEANANALTTVGGELLAQQAHDMSCYNTTSELVQASLAAEAPQDARLYLAASVISTAKEHEFTRQTAISELQDERCYMETIRTMFETNIEMLKEGNKAKDEKLKTQEQQILALKAELDAFKADVAQIKLAMGLSAMSI